MGSPRSMASSCSIMLPQFIGAVNTCPLKATRVSAEYMASCIRCLLRAVDVCRPIGDEDLGGGGQPRELVLERFEECLGAATALAASRLFSGRGMPEA